VFAEVLLDSLMIVSLFSHATIRQVLVLLAVGGRKLLTSVLLAVGGRKLLTLFAEVLLDSLMIVSLFSHATIRPEKKQVLVYLLQTELLASRPHCFSPHALF
jgi:hypothetical protein